MTDHANVLREWAAEFAKAGRTIGERDMNGAAAEIERLSAEVAEHKETLENLVLHARLLQANSEQCVVKHHGGAALPPWLEDTKRGICRARALVGEKEGGAMSDLSEPMKKELRSLIGGGICHGGAYPNVPFDPGQTRTALWKRGLVTFETSVKLTNEGARIALGLDDNKSALRLVGHEGGSHDDT